MPLLYDSDSKKMDRSGGVIILNATFKKLVILCTLLCAVMSAGCGSDDRNEKKKRATLPPGEAGIIELHVVASGSFPPYYFKDNEGAVGGISSDIVKEALSRAGFRHNAELYPVKRAVMISETKEPVLIFALFRTPEREKKYKWVAPVTPMITSALFRLEKRKDIDLHSLEDAKKYRIGVVRGNNLHQLLLEKGFRDNREIEPVMSNDVNIRKLRAGRIDLCAGRELPFCIELAQMGYRAEDAPVSLVLGQDRAWMAFSLSTPDGIVERVRAAYRSMESDGTVSRIFSATRPSVKKK